MDRHDEASRAAYEQLRRHVQRARPEHPAGRQESRASVAHEAPLASRVSVMSWLVAVGQVVVRKLRRRPGSPMIRIHPKE